MSRPFRLQLLGGMQLLAPVDASAEELARAALLDNRRRVLAVLAVLAVSPRSLTRDQLADFFWGDSEPARARHSLAESLRLLRRVLGSDAVATRTADVMLDAAAPLESDVVRFREAQAVGDHQGAVALYRADFLDGVYVERAPRFEEWADRQRESLREAFTASCAAECRRLAQQGIHTEAAVLARRWLDTAPLSRDAAESWLRALAAPGTTEALHRARERFSAYATQLETEYGAAPDRRLVQLLDDAEQALAAHRDAPSASRADVRSPAPAATAAATPVARPTAPPTTPPAATPPATAPVVTAAADPAGSQAVTARARHRRGRVAAALLAVVLPAAAWRLGVFDTPATQATDPSARLGVVIADAENATVDSLLGHVVTVAVSSALGEFPMLRPVSASRVRELRRLTTSDGDTAAARGPLTESMARTVATRAGASMVAVPVVVALGAQYRVALRLVQAGDGSLLTTTQSAVVAPDGLLSAMDEMLQRLRTASIWARPSDEPLRPLPDFTTASLPALRAYVQGARAFDRLDLPVALESYRQAVAIDSTFAVAWMALGSALAYINRPQDADVAFSAALRHEAHLTARERVMVRAAALRARGLADSAIALRSGWLRAHPDDVELMADQLYALLTASRRAEAVAVGEALIRRDSTDPGVLINLAMSYEGDDLPPRRRAVALYAKALALDPAERRNPMLPQLYGDLLVQAQMFDSAARFFASIGAGDERLHGRAMRALGQMELRRARPTAAIAPFERAVAAGQALGDTLTWVRARLWLAHALYAAGDTARGRAHTDSLAREVPLLREPPVQYWIGMYLARLGRVNDAAAALRALERVMVPGNRVHAGNRGLLAAEIATARGQARRALPALGETLRNGRSPIDLETVAWTALQAGDTATAREQARVILGWDVPLGSEGWLAQERTRGWSQRLAGETRR